MVRLSLTLAGCLSLLALSAPALAGGRGELRGGVAGHAFDHMESAGPKGQSLALVVWRGLPTGVHEHPNWRAYE